MFDMSGETRLAEALPLDWKGQATTTGTRQICAAPSRMLLTRAMSFGSVSDLGSIRFELSNWE